MDWRIKATVQAVLSLTPGGSRVNELLQRALGGRRHKNIQGAIETHFDEVRCMLQALERCGINLRGAHVLELGTGWDPAIALYLAGLGAKVTTMDVRRNLVSSRYGRQRLAGMFERIRSEALCFESAQIAAIQSYAEGRIEVEDLLRELGITYLAPVPDTSLVTMPPQSFDLVFSIAVFEHVPPRDLSDLMKGHDHVLKPQGLAYHDIGNGDHSTSTDSSVSCVNFLKYDGPMWRWLGENYIAYHNRLRRSDFDRLFADYGFEQQWCEHLIDERSLELLRSGRLKPVRRFAGYDIQDLATRRMRVVLARQGASKVKSAPPT